MQQIKTTMKAASSSSSSSSSCYGLRKARLSPYLFTSLTFIVFIAILFGKYFSFMSGQINANPTQPIRSINKNRETLPFAVGKTPEGCDLFSGRWVWGESNRPLYEESECPYIPSEMTCQEHGRPDKDYLYWRWQPDGCDLPSFNATLTLEKLRRKRMLFVGDSLNRGQFISMLCLLYSLIPENAKSLEYFDSLTVVTAKDYNATVEFYWAPFLLESNSDDSTFHRIPDRIVRKGSINKHGQHWKGVDILVFNTYQWWITSGSTIKIQEGSFDDKNKKIVHMPIEDAYRMVIKSMLRWMKLNADPKKTRVFFASMSPPHARRINWGGEPGINCYNKTILIEDPNYWGSHCSKDIMQLTGEEFSNSKFPITFLNITQLSLYRIDAHTSIYKKFWRTLTPEELADPNKYADCTHWCLPGVQDTWNELLFAKLFYP